MVSGKLTDTHTLVVKIILHGFAKLYNMAAPSEVESGESFDITYDIKNEGDIEDTLWGHILDAPDGNEITGSDWNQIIAVDETISKTFTHPGITKTSSLVIEVGHSPE